MEKIENKLDEILKELKTLRGDILPRLERLETHIDFVEDTYDGLRNPLNYIRGMFNSSPVPALTNKGVQPVLDKFNQEHTML